MHFNLTCKFTIQFFFPKANLFLYFKSIFLKIIFFFLLHIIFLFLNRFDVLILKIKIKYYFNIFSNKKYFEKHSIP